MTSVFFSIPLGAYEAPDKDLKALDFRCDVDPEGYCTFALTDDSYRPKAEALPALLLDECGLLEDKGVSEQPFWLKRAIRLAVAADREAEKEAFEEMEAGV